MGVLVDFGSYLCSIICVPDGEITSPSFIPAGIDYAEPFSFL